MPLIKNSAIIILILVIAFLSQLLFLPNIISGAHSNGVKSEDTYIGKAQDWLKKNVYDKLSGPAGQVSGEVAKTQEQVQQQITQQKDNLVENSTTAVKKILAEKVLQFLGVTPQELGSCPAVTVTK